MDPQHFAGQVVDEKSHRITSWWVGQPIEPVVSFAATRPDGFTITLVPGARYSRPHLQIAASALAESPLGHSLASTVAVQHDGSGLSVSLTGPLPQRVEQERLAAAAGLPVDALTFVPDDGLDGMVGTPHSQ